MKLKLMISLLILSTTLLAQDVKLDTLTVTGTKSEKFNSDSPIKTDLVTNEEIKEKSYTNAAEALRDVPGLVLTSNYGKAGLVPIIQGLSSEHILVLIDGTPQTPNGSTGFDLSSILSSDIERIEIVKGASSVLYGSSALGGVINIITKKPSNTFNFFIKRNYYFEAKPETEIPYNDLSLNFSQIKNKFSYKFILGNSKERAIDRDKRTIYKDTEDREMINGTIGLSYKLDSKNNFSLDYKKHTEENREHGVYNGTTSDYKVYHDGLVKKDSLRLKHEYNNENVQVESYLFYESIYDEFKINDDPKTSYPENLTKYDFSNIKGESFLRSTYNDNNILTAGIFYSKETLDGTTREQNLATIKKSKEVDNKFEEVIESYLQNDFIGNDYEVIGGFRYSFNQNYKDNISPKVNLSKNFKLKNEDKIVLRSAVGTGYKIPTIKQRYYDKKGSSYIVQGNKDLKAESSTNYQLGADYYKKESFYLGLNSFFNKVRNLISRDFTFPSSGIPFVTYKNTSSSSTWGIELSGGFKLKKRFYSDTSLTYTRSIDDDTGKIISDRPFVTGKQEFKLTLTDKSKLIYVIRYFGHSYANLDNKTEYKPYSTNDFHFNYKINQKTDVSLGINNIFNDTSKAADDDPYSDLDNRPSLGRVGFISLNLTL